MIYTLQRHELEVLKQKLVLLVSSIDTDKGPIQAELEFVSLLLDRGPKRDAAEFELDTELDPLIMRLRNSAEIFLRKRFDEKE